MRDIVAKTSASNPDLDGTKVTASIGPRALRNCLSKGNFAARHAESRNAHGSPRGNLESRTCQWQKDPRAQSTDQVLDTAWLAMIGTVCSSSVNIVCVGLLGRRSL
eukprot:182106-Amphidinium_carterae.1